MFILWPVLIAIAAALIFPGWWYSGRAKGEDVIVLWLPAISVAIWLLLIMAFEEFHLFGIDLHKSLSNAVVEPAASVALAVVAAYLKLFVFNRAEAFRAHGMPMMLAIVALAVACVTFFTPSLPE